MECALWLNRRKVRHASEIHDNLDVASLRGYFLAGSLSEWLCENGGEAYAKKLAGLSPDDPKLNEKLARIFGGKANFGKALNTAPQDGSERRSTAGSSFTPPSSFRFTEFGSGSFTYSELTSFGEFWELLRKLQSGSFAGGSYLTGSFAQWEWLFALYRRWYSGSFTFGSFSFGSFHEWEWEWLWRVFGGGGSYSASSFNNIFGSFGFGLSGLFGSFGFIGGKALGSLDLITFMNTLDEYDRIMFETLMICPLDRFGYGIHNI